MKAIDIIRLIEKKEQEYISEYKDNVIKNPGNIMLGPLIKSSACQEILRDIDKIDKKKIRTRTTD